MCTMVCVSVCCCCLRIFFIHSAISQRDWRQTEKYTAYFDHTRAETLERTYAYVACKSEMATNIITRTGDRLINQYRHL